jgi:L-Ala-D/L-Glu epimerase
VSAQVRIQRLELTELAIPFRASFRHASAERTATSSVWVEAVSERGTVGCGEACPRSYVTGETQASARAFFRDHEASVRGEVTDLASLRGWTAASSAAIDRNPAAWCAIELAILDLLARESDQTIEAFLSLPPLRGRFAYTAVLGDSSAETFRATAEEYRRRGFDDFKVKLSGDLPRDRAKLALLASWPDPAPRVRVDANNLWESADEAVHYLHALGASLFAVEEPIQANDYEGLARIGAELGCRIVLDESFQRAAQTALLPVLPATGGTGSNRAATVRPRSASQPWLINLRVSKMGGLLRSLDVVAAAREMGIPLIVGAQVGETSLLTRAGLTVAHAAGADLVAQEGAFGTLLLERDVCEPPLMFGPGGVLDVADHPRLVRSGLGVAGDRVPREAPRGESDSRASPR